MKKQTDTLTLSLFEDDAPVLPEPAKQAPIKIIVDATEVQEALRDSICKKWRTCHYGVPCMDDTINLECLCYLDEPDNRPAKCFSRDEQKVLNAGFSLVRYNRDEKMIKFAESEGISSQWIAHPDSPFQTFAQAERTMKSMLEDEQMVASGNDSGQVGYCKKLYAAGFEFYRIEGVIQGNAVCRIKQGSKNWGTWQKFDNSEDCEAAWNELMKDEKALEG